MKPNVIAKTSAVNLVRKYAFWESVALVLAKCYMAAIVFF